LHWLPGDLGYQVVVAVEMQERDLLAFGDSRDEQVGKADRPDSAATPQPGLRLKRTMPVLVMSDKPLVAFLAVSPDQVKLGTAARRPAESTSMRRTSPQGQPQQGGLKLLLLMA
jgi:hypothetical protein